MSVFPCTTRSDVTTISGTAASSALTMVAGQFYMFVSSTNCYIKQAAAAVITGAPATAGDGSMFVPAGVIILLEGRQGDTLSMIQASAGGSGSLTPCKIT